MGQPAKKSDFRRQLVWLFFLIDGRIGRYAFILGILGMSVLQALALYRFMLAPEGTTGQGLWAIAFWGLFFTSIWCTMALAVKRLHDFGKPGIFALTLFIPVVIFIAFGILCLVPGDPGPNRYGPRTDARADGS